MPSNKGITWGHKSEPYQHHVLFNLRIVEVKLISNSGMPLFKIPCPFFVGSQRRGVLLRSFAVGPG